MDMALALFLKKNRKKMNLTQWEVAERLGYSTLQFVSNWECGRSSPPLATCKTLCKIFEIDKNKMYQMLMDQYSEEVRKALR